MHQLKIRLISFKILFQKLRYIESVRTSRLALTALDTAFYLAHLVFPRIGCIKF